MAVVVTDLRTVRNEADTTTGWTGAGGTSTAVFAEATASVIATLNIATGQVYHTGAAIDLSNTLVYVWSNNFAQQGSWDGANPANALHLGDGTDRISFKMAGNNRKVFAHLDAGAGVSVDWDCLVLDGSQAAAMNTAGHTTVRAGTFAGLNLAAITQIGSDFTTLSKGLGGGINVAVDIIRYGNLGILIGGGTTGDRGNFLEVVLEDRSTANLKALGIIRELGAGLYSVQGPLNFGAGSGATWFEDTGRVILFENRNISDDKYFIATIGNLGSSDNNFILRGCTITTAGPAVRCTFGEAATERYLDNLELTGNSFSTKGIVEFSGTFSGFQHKVTGNTFNGCGLISPRRVNFSGNTITNSVGVSGALEWILDSNPPFIPPLLDSTGVYDCRFEQGTGTGHAILINNVGTYEFSGIEFRGFGANETVTSAVYNNSGGAVTINISGGGDTPTVRNGVGATTTINNTKNFTFTLRDTNEALMSEYEWRIYEADPIQGIIGSELDGEENRISSTYTYSYNYVANIDIILQIIKTGYEEGLFSLTLSDTDQNVTVRITEDTNL